MMRSALTAVGLLVGCQSEEAVPAPTPINPLQVAFVTQCQYDNGSRVLLTHRFASDTYQLIVSRGSNNDLTTIRANGHDGLEIETNGGIGKIAAVENLLHWLLRQPFRVVDEDGFAAEIERRDVPDCPGVYPFSP
jgi:hypothetical protein